MYTQDVVNDNGDATLNRRQRKPRTENVSRLEIETGLQGTNNHVCPWLFGPATMTSQRLGEVASTYDGKGRPLSSFLRNISLHTLIIASAQHYSSQTQFEAFFRLHLQAQCPVTTPTHLPCSLPLIPSRALPSLFSTQLPAKGQIRSVQTLYQNRVSIPTYSTAKRHQRRQSRGQAGRLNCDGQSRQFHRLFIRCHCPG